MRIIDADKLAEEFKRRHRAALRWKEEALINGNEESVIRADATLAFLSEVKITIDNAPTIERPRPTIERPRGEWVKNNDTVFINRFNCSLCGRLIFEPKDKNNFCPKCGAYMRGGRK